MGLYAKRVLPRLLDCAMRNRALDRYRREAVGLARGAVLEIGVGSGLNLPLYGAAVERLYALEPSAELLSLARRRAKNARVPFFPVQASAEQIPFANAGFNTIVMTWTLCSIPDAAAALGEMRRVLKPGGKLLFVEHGLSHEARIARWQRRLTPCWAWISGGCHLDRKTDDLLRAAGFRIDRLDTGYLKGPKPWTFMYEGAAVG